MNVKGIPGLVLCFFAGGASVMVFNRCSKEEAAGVVEAKSAEAGKGGISEARKRELEVQGNVKRATGEMLARDEYLREIGAKSKRLDPFKVRLIDANGAILAAALEEVGLDPAEKPNIQQLVDETRSSTKELVKSKAVVEKVDDPESDHPKFVIKVESDTNQGNEILSTLETKFSQKYGPEKAAKLMALIDDSRMLGAFGRQNQLIEVVAAGGREKWNVIWNYSNPRSGEKIAGGTALLPRFSEVGVLDGGWIKEVIGEGFEE